MGKVLNYVVLQDIVIPKGTVLTLGPVTTKYCESHFVSTRPFGKDHTAEFVIPQETMEAHPDLFIKLKGWNG